MEIYSVSQITSYIKERLASDVILGDLWIRGEVSNLAHSAAGHYYFTLKDDNSQMRCVMFRPAFGSENLSDGRAVAAHGRVSLYEVRGDIQLYVSLVQPEGVGEHYLELERLKIKLESEGLFLESRKRQLPAFPKRIGVATSPYGSVWHDIRNIIDRRFPIVELVLSPTPVQGDGAPAGIVDAFEAMNREGDLDVVILARGGGSVEELSPFNEEIVARAIYSSRVPVISAVGHETDFTIADMVADCRAPTPSAAAEIVVPDIEILFERILFHARNMSQCMQGSIDNKIQYLEQTLWRIQRLFPDIPSLHQRIDDITHGSWRSLESYLTMRRERINALESRLASLSPNNVLTRGYAMVHRLDNAMLVASVSEVVPGDDIQINVRDGIFTSRTLSTNNSDDQI